MGLERVPAWIPHHPAALYPITHQSKGSKWKGNKWWGNRRPSLSNIPRLTSTDPSDTNISQAAWCPVQQHWELPASTASAYASYNSFENLSEIKFAQGQTHLQCTTFSLESAVHLFFATHISFSLNQGSALQALHPLKSPHWMRLPHCHGGHLMWCGGTWMSASHSTMSRLLPAVFLKLCADGYFARAELMQRVAVQSSLQL